MELGSGTANASLASHDHSSTVLLTAPPDLPEPSLTRNGRTVLERRYLHKNDMGQPLETPSGALWRVACEVARGSEAWTASEDAEGLSREYYRMMARLDFLPNS